MPVEGGRRSAGLDSIRNKKIPGVYILNVPKCVKSYHKIGISTTDIERRLESYLGYYPWSYYVVAVILYKNDEDKFKKCRKAESELLKSLKAEHVKNFKNQKRTEWVRLKSPAKIQQTLDKMEEIAIRTGGSFTAFGKTHEIKLPE